VIVLSLVLGILAVARLTRFIVEDRLAIGLRRWVVKKWGADSMPSYLVHCPWCVSVWWALFVMPSAVLYPNQWVIAILAIPTASLVTGLIFSKE